MKSSRLRVDCYIEDRSHGDCYTDVARQRGKPAGTKGGPLVLDADTAGAFNYGYIFLRGFCQKDDRRQPHPD